MFHLEHPLHVVEYLVDNIYINVGIRVFRQCVGIPMGLDWAPHLANLLVLLGVYEEPH